MRGVEVLRPVLRRVRDGALLDVEGGEREVLALGALEALSSYLRRVTGVSAGPLVGAAVERRYGDPLPVLRRFEAGRGLRRPDAVVRAVQTLKSAVWDLLDDSRPDPVLVPALDVMDGGLVVRSGSGGRSYVPLPERFDLPGDPVEALEVLVERYPVGAVYVADLDALFGRGSNEGVVDELAGCFDLPFVVDAGGRFYDVDGDVRFVVPSEAYEDVGSYLRDLEEDVAVAGLDLDGSEVLGPWDSVGDFLDDVVDVVFDRSPGVVVVDVGAVGSGEGPPFEAAQAVGAFADAFVGGGVGCLEHLELLAGTPGVTGVLVGSLLFSGVDPEGVERALDRGSRLRVHHMGLEEEFLEAIKRGEKTVEGRVKDDKRARIRPGDKILFNRRLLVEVVDVREYDSFEEMLRSEGLERVLPGVESVEEGVRVYRRFYSTGKEKMFGVLAIEVKPLMDLWEGIVEEEDG